MVSLDNCLSIAHMVEALLILLKQDSLAPPLWFKSEARKLLSRLIMQEGAVAITLGRLVGGTQLVNNSTLTNWKDMVETLLSSFFSLFY